MKLTAEKREQLWAEKRDLEGRVKMWERCVCSAIEAQAHAQRPWEHDSMIIYAQEHLDKCTLQLEHVEQAIARDAWNG